MELAPKLHFREQPLKRLQRYLQPGENLLWHGGSARGIRRLNRQKARARRILSMLPLVIFVLAKAVWKEELPLTNPGLLLIFAFILCTTVGQFLLDNYRRRHYYYAVTDQRVILMYKDTMESYPFPEITELSVELHDRKERIGTVFLTPPVYVEKGGTNVESDHRPGLLFVREPFRVYDLIEAQIELHEQTTLSENT